MAKKNVYAVRKGVKTGIFISWEECEKQIKGFKGAEFKGFSSTKQAQEYLDDAEDRKEEQRKDSKADVPRDAFEIYIDGSFNPDRKIAAYGLVIVKNSKVFLKDFSAYPYSDIVESHNVGAELMGAKRAVELALANNIKELVVYYDYIGIEKFANNIWKAKTPQTKEYQLFMRMYMRLVEIHFVKIKAHSGNKFNDIADKLAKSATHL
jgi:Predicted double-stranded RNA/RNA-DNA hybrid binding protein